MRALLAFLLSAMLSLNAAHAAVLGVCDALEHGSPQALSAKQTSHFGHHSHEHIAASASPAGNGMADLGDAAQHLADHSHAHASFFSLTPGDSTLRTSAGRSPLTERPEIALVSVQPAQLERPPRTALA